MNQQPSWPNDAYNQAPTTRMPTSPQAPANQPGYRGEPALRRPAQPARMPRARAQEITRTLKNALIAGSIMAFGALAALAAGHATGVTASATSGGSAGSGANTPSAPTSAPRSDDSGGFFNSAPSNGASGGFGVSPSAPSTAPITGSSVS